MSPRRFPRLRRAARWIFRAVAVVVVVPVLVVLWHTPLSNGYLALSATELEQYVRALEESGRPPTDFVLSQLATHDVVILGESHRVAQDAQFVQDLIEPVYRQAGVRRLVIEFGSQADQAVVDEMLRAPTFDRAAAKRVLGGFGHLWLYEEYLGIFAAAWRWNAALGPGSPPFEITLGTPPRERRGHKDAEMAQLVLAAVGRGEKVLVYCGSHHGFTRYRQPLPFEALYLPGGRPGRMGNRLHAALGDRVAFVRLHGAVAKRWAYFAWLLYRRPMLLPFGGVIDRAHRALGQPVGFDTSLEPFGSLKDEVSYYSLHRPGLTLSSFADGYIVLASMEQRRAVRPFTDLGDAAELAFLRARFERASIVRACRSPEDLRRWVETDGLFPEKAWEKTDRAGFDQAAWLPSIRAFWVAVAGLGLGWALRRWWARRRRA